MITPGSIFFHHNGCCMVQAEILSIFGTWIHWFASDIGLMVCRIDRFSPVQHALDFFLNLS
jgi:hypothetical protein